MVVVALSLDFVNNFHWKQDMLERRKIQLEVITKVELKLTDFGPDSKMQKMDISRKET